MKKGATKHLEIKKEKRMLENNGVGKIFREERPLKQFSLFKEE